MALPIRIFGDPVLRLKAKSINKIDATIIKLAQEMFETMRQASGIGLAGNQVGVAKRIFVIDLSPVIPESKPMVLINPEMTESKGEQFGEEGCLSIPGIHEDVARFKQVKFSALDLSGKKFEIEASDLLARALQHELDHLNGILFIDHLSEVVRNGLGDKLKKLRPTPSKTAL
ncbi:MAG: peptide deformylase [candidate division Zixibacteria bacterium]|nr:peptide deformylase [candidate division Zixibacteria bacterium]